MLSSFESDGPRIYSVSALTEEIRGLLEDRFDFLWVEGEVSNFRVPASGHFYMVLKDDRAQIRAVMFRPRVRSLKFRPEDGMKVLCNGRLAVYPPRGEYQIILDYLEPLGVGALALAFEQLKRKLAAQGLFDPEKKKPLPFLPQKVAVITSPTGAAIRDFLKVIHRRFANIEVILVPARVQGEGAAEEIIQALRLADREPDVDVIVLTRGGGSLEDLWAFNDEALAHAIRASRIPVVSAVGHEIDVTISDLAADYRAPTPSAAAEILVREKEALRDRISILSTRMERALMTRLQHWKQQLALLRKGLVDPRRALGESWLHLDDLVLRLTRNMSSLLKERRNKLISEQRTLLLTSPANLCRAHRERLEYRKLSLENFMERRLEACGKAFSLLEEKIKALNPYSVLKRGYSITRTLPGKEILREATRVAPEDRVEVLLAEGAIECSVEKVFKGDGNS
ncbi:MAG: exodeoxyribonuclease VII large subunit [Deltaproteobacteria bacterium]|nr:exodeoxyribonuclease VII large subunit [Deltaproteobacteria bacterium]MBW2015454.1 exodeoxyribonuclease VII large subunit [Deltaproteobacteria bacterium]MBW2129672.1 exodeoxyribonuclease VII large subunit [Deltaproteobacteria bacterium]